MNIIDRSMSSPSNTGDVRNPRGTSAGTNAGGTGTAVNGNAVRQTAVITGNMLLAQMQPGSSFSGDIIDVRGSAIRILLGNDKTLNATTTDSKNLNIGDHITFNVASNDGKTVLIKPLKINNFNTNVLLKALEAAEVPANEKNVETVKAMMRNEMSIDKDSLADMIKKVETFKTDRPEDIVAMVRHEIPLTQENVEQFATYKNYEHRIVAQTENMANDIPELLKDMLGDGQEQKVSQLAEKLINILDDNIPEEQVMTKDSEGTVLVKNLNVSENTVPVSEEDKTFLNKMGLDEAGVTYETEQVDTAVKEKLTNSQVIDNLGTLKGEELKEFLDSPEFKDFIKDKVERGLELNVNRLGQRDEEVKENVKKLYENLNTKTESILKALESAGQRDSTLGRTSENIRNNMQFMQDLSQMAAYVQLPVKFNENKAHGELYVFNRKKGMPVDKDVVTAFLHLDMDNLGATDIHVTLEKKSVKTEFSISDEVSMNIIESHLHELKERLEKKGYTATLSVEIEPGEAETNPFDKALEVDKPQISIKRYSFDVRA